MPKSPPKLCKNPLCKNRFERNTPEEGRHGLCSSCTEKQVLKDKTKQKTTHRSDELHDIQAQKFYNSRLWRNLSRRHREKNPLCVHCLESGIIKAADVADHIIEIKDDWDKRLEAENLQSLCHACHNCKTAKEKRLRLKARS